MAVDPIAAMSPTLLEQRDRIEGVLRAFLREMRTEMVLVAPDAALPIDEVIRLVEAGGKRLRPAFCYWGFRAAGGREEEPIARAAAAMELLHTMALIHDDLMDATPERRGVPSSAQHLANEARGRGALDPEGTGRSLAILTGDLAAVLADRALLTAGFDADVLRRGARSVPPDAHGHGARSVPGRAGDGGAGVADRGHAQGRVLHRGGTARDRRRAGRSRPRDARCAGRLRRTAGSRVPAP